jgi:DNA polymerase-3 subunit epsilon
MAFHWIGKSSDGKTVTLRRLEPQHFQFPEYFTPEWESLNSDHIRIGAVLDVETTGLNQVDDQIIEIGIRQFKFNRSTGEVLALESTYSAFQDPGIPLSAEVTAITGITDDMVQGQSIDWGRVDELLNTSSIIIAHNAGFDRPFVDRKSSVSPKKIWGCSFKQIDWEKKGYTSQKLEVLSIYHGFFNDAHRALSDADSLIYLLSFSAQVDGNPYLLELLQQARKPMVHLLASGAPFDSKTHLKNRSYRWDAPSKTWFRVLEKDSVQEEIRWLEEVVYSGPFRGTFQEIQLTDQFKSTER